ncbi:hypothetical protein Q9189_005915 [Teloschistes chrysophthalmus]
MAFTCFLKLPLEIREHVYRSYFSDLDLSVNFSVSPLLLCSNQIHEEAQLLFWQNARFTFRDVLPLFPGLQLSTLRVVDPFHGNGIMEDGWGHDATYHGVDDFIKSQGFKELTYVVQHHRFLKSTRFRNAPVATEPSTWDTKIKERDGIESGASVTIFRVSNGDILRVSNEEKQIFDEFETIQKASDAEEEPNDFEEEADDVEEEARIDGELGSAGLSPRSIPFCIKRVTSEGGTSRWVETEYDPSEWLPPHQEYTSQIEVRIKRGKEADYEQKGEQSNVLARRLLDLFQELTWKEIKEKGLYVDSENAPTAHL